MNMISLTNLSSLDQQNESKLPPWSLWDETISEPGQDLIGRCVMDRKDDSIGSVRYVGTLPSSRGIWFGIDWQDETRGRHNGSYANHQYFETRHPTSGSFLRANKLSFGVSFEEAVDLRYGRGLQLLANELNERIGIGSLGMVGREDCVDLELERKTRPGITIEVMGAGLGSMPTVDWKRLKSVSLQETPVVALDGRNGGLIGQLPQVKELNLSRTLITRWPEVAQMCLQLPKLEYLTVSDNELAPLHSSNTKSFHHCFLKTNYLVMVRLRYSWQNIVTLLEAAFTHLTRLVVAYNSIIEIPSGPLPPTLAALTTLDLAGNQLSNFTRDVLPFGSLLHLSELILSSNKISEIEFPDEYNISAESEMTTLFPALTLIGLGDNPIGSWSSISALSRLPLLDDLLLWEVPLLERHGLNLARSLIIARFPRLHSLNRTFISVKERRTADIDYYKQHGMDYLAAQTSEEAIRLFHKNHPYYDILVEKFGPPIEGELKPTTKALKEGLINLTIQGPDLDQSKSLSRRLPLRMTVHHLLALVRRLFRLSSSRPIALVRTTPISPGQEFPLDSETRELAYYDLENGDTLLVKQIDTDAKEEHTRPQCETENEGDFLTSRLTLKPRSAVRSSALT